MWGIRSCLVILAFSTHCGDHLTCIIYLYQYINIQYIIISETLGRLIWLGSAFLGCGFRSWFVWKLCLVWYLRCESVSEGLQTEKRVGDSATTTVGMLTSIERKFGAWLKGLVFLIFVIESCATIIWISGAWQKLHTGSRIKVVFKITPPCALPTLNIVNLTQKVK